jgi:probable rRNA maturation factor
MPVLLTNRQRRFPVDTRRLGGLARACLAHLGLSGADLSILLVNDPAMRALNRRHRGVSATTDVLSFPQYERPADLRRAIARPAGGGPAPELGDVVISVERARVQAARAGVAPEAELALLLVHGVLHLTGHDHERGAHAAARMAEAERNMLTSLGFLAKGLVAREMGGAGT